MNPLTKIREKMGLSRAEFAGLLDIPYQTLANFELGYCGSISGTLFEALEGVGVDARSLGYEYRRWRKARAKARAASLEVSV